MEQNNQNKHDMDDMLISYLIGNCTDEQKRLIEIWLSEGKENEHYLDQIRDIFYLGKVTKDPSGFDKEKSLTRIKSDYYKQKYLELKEGRETTLRRRVDVSKMISIAAAVLLLISLGFNFLHVFRPAINHESLLASAYNEITAPKGSRTHIALPDGTKVWLNAGSKIRFPMNFLNGDRNVSLVGEAYFEVKKSNEKQFIVHTSDLAIKVWGTKFNVKAYPDERTIQTTLVEGSISIQKIKAKWHEEETYLSPNQTAIYYKSTNKLPEDIPMKSVPLIKITPQSIHIENQINTILYTSWKDQKWIIAGQTLGDLARELERRFNVIIRFENESIKQYRFTGILSEETFEQVLEVIKFSAPVECTVKNNEVIFKENKDSKTRYDKFLKR